MTRIKGPRAWPNRPPLRAITAPCQPVASNSRGEGIR